MLSYLSRIIKQAFFLVNTLSELLTHLHEFLEANQGRSYTFITGFQWRIENVLIRLLRQRGIWTTEQTIAFRIP